MLPPQHFFIFLACVTRVIRIKSLKNSQEGFDILPQHREALQGTCWIHAVGTCVFTLLCTPAPLFDSQYLNELLPTTAAVCSSMAPPFGSRIQNEDIVLSYHCPHT